MKERLVEVVEIGGRVCAVAVLSGGQLQVVFEGAEFEGGRGRRVVLRMKESVDLRLGLAASLLSADGAKAHVKLTWQKPPKKTGSPSARRSKRAKNGAKA